MNPSQEPSDRKLVQQFKAGDTSALARLVKRYHQSFCARAYWIIKDKELAKDIAQETWLSISKRMVDLKNEGSFKSWAFKIIYNKSIDAVNKKNKERIDHSKLNPTNFNAPKEDNHKDQLRLALLLAIRELPKHKQDVIRLFYTDSYSISEISSFLNIPRGTVKSRLFEAREKLKSLLKK